MISKLIKKGNDLVFSVTAKNIYLVGSGNLISIVTGTLFYILVARSLSVSELGVFTSISAFILIISDFTEFGFGSGLSNFIPPLLKENNIEKINQISKTTFTFQMIMSLILSILIILFAPLISMIIFSKENQSYLYLVSWSALGVLTYSIFNFIVSLFVSKESFNKVFRLQSIQSILKVTVVVIYLFLAKLNTFSVFFIFLLSPLIAILLVPLKSTFAFLKTSGFYPLRKLIKFNIFLALNKLFVVLFSRLDVIMLTSLGTTYEAGLYGVASKVAFIYPLVGGSIGTVFGPKYAKLSIKEAVGFTKKSSLVIFALIISLILLILIAPFLIPFVFGEKYVNSVPILQALLIATVPFLISIPINNLLTYSLKKPYILAVSSLVQLIIVFSLNFILIPKYGGLAPPISIGIAGFTALIISIAAFYIYVWDKR